MISLPGFIAWILLFGLFGIATWQRPANAIAALACIYGLKQLGETSHAWLAANALVSNFAVAALVALAVARRLMQGDQRRSRLPSAFWFSLAFYGYALLSLAWTPALTPALKIWGHDYPYIVLLVFVAPWLAITNVDLRQAFGLLGHVGGLLVVALLFTGRWGDRGLIVGSGITFDETNPLAIADLAGVVAVAALFTTSVRRSAIMQAARLFIAGVCAIAIVRSGSRGQLIAACATILLMLPVAYPIGRLRSSGAAMVAIAVVGGAIAYGVVRYVHWWDARWVKSGAVGDATGRWTMVARLLRAWSQDGMTVLFGVGNSGSFAPSIAGFYPHNMPLEILGEEGVVGFSLYLVLVVHVLMTAYRGVRCAEDDLTQRGLLAVTLGCFLFTLMVSLKQGNAVSNVLFFMFSVFAVQAAALIRANNIATPVTERLPSTMQPAFPNLMR